MSELLVPVVQIEKILPHSNADNLELAQIGGWQVVVLKGQFTEGQVVTYFPPDVILPLAVSDAFNVTKYLQNGRVRAVKLRGEPSFGFVQPAPSDVILGDNLAERYGITKYVAPFKPSSADAAPQDERFPRYTDIDNLRHYPHVFEDGEMVVVTEKIHGANCRIAVIEGERMAGSHDHPRRKVDNSLYWFPWSLLGVEAMMQTFIDQGRKQAILFGEVYGSPVQGKMPYGLQGKVGFRAFDLMVEGKYLDHDEFLFLCKFWGVETVPVLATVPFSSEIKKFADGATTIDNVPHIREGIVIRPVQERLHPKIGRVILKYISDAYILKQYNLEEMEDE